MSGGLALRPRPEEEEDDGRMALISRLASGGHYGKPNLPSAETLPPEPPVAPPNTPLQGMLMPKGKAAWKEMHDSKEGVSYFVNPATGEKKFLRDALNDPELGERAYKLLQYQEAQRKKGITGGE
jgi:hypothetical protein